MKEKSSFFLHFRYTEYVAGKEERSGREWNRQMTNTDRNSEMHYLRDTLSIVEEHLTKYEEEIERTQESIDEMLVHYHDNDVELWTLLNNTITINEHMKRAYAHCIKAKKKPYFGRIIYTDEELGKEVSLYIGRGDLSVNYTKLQVVDWRAPVATAYYENGLGKCAYMAPGGKEIPIDLKLKRTFEIEDGVLKDYYDTDVVANDELLTKYLSRNKEAVLGEIVATIQKEQNEIIRKTPLRNTLVQGVAGSGKTTVAMHRISYILYNYPERFRPEDFYIVGSNRILLNYITGVLPDLDVSGVRQMTMEQLLLRLLYEDAPLVEGKIKPLQNPDDSYKGTTKWFQALLNYIRRLENDAINQEDVLLHPRQFVEGFENGETGVYDRRESDRKEGKASETIVLVEGSAVERYVSKNPNISIQSKINMLNERLKTRVEEEFLMRGIRYSEAERKAITKAYRGFYGPKDWKVSILVLYRDFLREQREKGILVSDWNGEADVYDLAALALLYKLVKETEVISEAHHIVIDEAQDFGMMVYHVLNTCIKDCTYTVMGDVSQNIHFGYGLSDWEELRKLLICSQFDSFCTLRKSYRNTIEISDFATNILRHGSFPIYPVEPIIRHGNPVRVEHTRNLVAETVRTCLEWQKRNLKTIAVICRDKQTAVNFGEALSKQIPILDTDPEKLSFGNGIMVLPVEYTKGLEFDACILLEPSEKNYPTDDGHAKLLYVAATRALHELCIFYSGNLTGLIAAPLPENKTTSVFDVSTGKEESKISVSAKAPTTLSPQSIRPKAIARPQVQKTVSPANPFQPKVISPDSYRSPGKNIEKKPAGLFGDIPDVSLLKPLGHARRNFAVRWVLKEKKGVSIQSQGGITYMVPVTDHIFRICYGDALQGLPKPHQQICDGGCTVKFSCRENSKVFELSTKAAKVVVEKQTGVISFYDAMGKLFFAEKGPESHVKAQTQHRWYLSLAKKEKWTAFRPATDLKPISLNGSSRYVSDSENREVLPLLCSDQGYALVPATTADVFFCDISAYGTFLALSEEPFDVYLILGMNSQQGYTYLMGR